MMRKKGLLGKLFFLIAIVVLILIITSTTLYFKLKKGNLEIIAGRATINIDYNTTKPENATNKTIPKTKTDSNYTIEEVEPNYERNATLLSGNKSSNYSKP